MKITYCKAVKKKSGGVCGKWNLQNIIVIFIIIIIIKVAIVIIIKIIFVIII